MSILEATESIQIIENDNSYITPEKSININGNDIMDKDISEDNLPIKYLSEVVIENIDHNKAKQNGYIHLILGCMFSAKTSMLISVSEKLFYTGRKILYIKSSKDTRSKTIQSHNGRLDIPCISIEHANDIYNYKDINFDIIDCIAIDEGQFIGGLCKEAEKWANDGKIVLIAALNSDFNKNIMGDIGDLIPKAEKIKKLYAVCECGQNAYFTYKLKPGEKSKFTSNFTKIKNNPDIENNPDILNNDIDEDKKNIDIGSSDKYTSLCRKCYNMRVGL